ncbi:MAG: hypothetical protein NDI73_05350 [Desulfuromonadales bacterium]|nr:hypothetical protein [Desulfuromonadales bacterium]
MHDRTPPPPVASPAAPACDPCWSKRRRLTFSFPRSVPGRLLVLALIWLAWLLAGTPLRAASLADATAADTGGELPSELGTIVYRVRGDAPLQLYIVASSHRSAASGANGADTLQAQVETFRIGEWLIRNGQIGLLLPESFFGQQADVAPVAAGQAPLDSATLMLRLGDTATFVNAELLLHEQYGIGLLQVEDRELYRHTQQLLHAGLTSAACLDPSFSARLANLQKRRSAAFLQGAPAALAQLSPPVSGTAPGALLTIGLAHLGDILEFLESGTVCIPAPPAGDAELPAVQASLTLLANPVGITVIVPPALLDNLPGTVADRG